MKTYRKSIFIAILTVLLSIPFFRAGNARADDPYEENDSRETAWPVEYNWVRKWLSDINGFGIQADDDWYRMDVDPGVERIQVDCRFTHADGDIDMELYDSDGIMLIRVFSLTDNEFIDHNISSDGTYYVRVYSDFGSTGNTYDLRWDDLTDDAYEENDALWAAWHPGYNWERTWLSDIDGLGIQADDDWYRIDVDLGSERIRVNCEFIHAEGDLDIELYDSTGTLLVESNSTTDNEFIDYTDSVSGTHYIRVHKGNAGNTYDLWWDDLPEDAYEENDTLGAAWHPGYNWERTWLSDIGGLGIQADDDWYRIGVDMASERIQVDCQFTHAEGDIDIELYDSTGALVGWSKSVTDHELIDHPISVSGTYYIRVFYDGELIGIRGNSYNLRWDDFSSGPTAMISDFGIAGLYQYEGGSWSRLTPSDPQYLTTFDNKLAGDFGVDGLWEFDGTSWAKLTSSDPDNTGNCMVAYGTGLAIDFGGLGLYRYEGGIWSKLTVSDAEYLAVYNGKLVGDFGGVGVWEFDGGSWAKLTSSDPDNTGNCMVAYGAGVVIDFGGLGLYRYDGGEWSRLTHSDAEYLAVYNGMLVGDFGVYGLWEFDGAHWTQLTPSDPDNDGNCMVAYGTGLAIDFGALGLYRYEDSAWSRLTVSDSEHLAVYDDKLVGDFGSAGLWEFDGNSWTKLTSADADNTGNCMTAVHFQ